MLKEKRQQKIRTLIQAKNIGTQEELTELLSKNAFSVTQSSISRDLEELRIVKVNGYYSLPLAADAAQKFGLLGLEAAGDGVQVVEARRHAGLLGARRTGEHGRVAAHALDRPGW